MKPIVAAMGCAVVWTMSGSVLAAEGEMPAECLDSPATQRAYESGSQLGHSIVQRAWLSVDDCTQLDYFASVVRANIESYVLSGTSTYLLCRYSGFVDGAYEELDDIMGEQGCGDCCWEGRLFGALGADVYCKLSNLFGGLCFPNPFVPRPVVTCGGFSACCYDEFSDVSETMCAEYTEPPYDGVWEGSADLQCDYD